MTSLKVFLLSFVLVFAVGLVVIAQEAPPAEETTGVGGGYSPVATVEEAVNLDEDIQPEDLEVSEPRLLPDSPFYFLKNWARGIQNLLTVNPIKKAGLRMKFANEKLMEVKKMVQERKNPEKIKEAAENYQQETAKVERVAQKIKEKAEKSEQVGKFLDKYIQQQILHQRILQKLQEQVPAEVYEKIEQVRQEHLEKFGEVITRLENKEKLQERLEQNLEGVKGSQFKNFKNLEILLELKEKVPEAAKEAIQKAQENALKRLKGNLEQMSPEDQEKFKEYLEEIGGLKERQLEIMENLRLELKSTPNLQENIGQVRERIIEQIQERVQERNCTPIEKPASDFCQEGRIVVKKDENGCPVSFECVVPAEVEIPQTTKPATCITLWDPVCGKNGKTYSNTCFAKLAGIEVDYKGKCQVKGCQTDADCPQPKCGPAGTVAARCANMQAKCVEGECKIISVTPFAPQINQ